MSHWTLLLSELKFIYLEPLLAEQVPSLLGKALLSFVHPDDEASAKQRIGYIFNWIDTPDIVRFKFKPTEAYLRVKLTIYWAAAGLVLCFIHIPDLNRTHKTMGSNCGAPHLHYGHRRMCYSALSAMVSVLEPKGKMFQILENAEGHSLLLSWFPEHKNFTPSAKDTMRIATYAIIEAAAAGNGTTMSCTYLYKARHALPSGAEVESIFIPYGSIVFACHQLISPTPPHTYNPSRSPPPRLLLSPYTEPSRFHDPQPEVPHSIPRMTRGPSPHPATDWTSDGSVDRPLRRNPDVHNSSPYVRPRPAPLKMKKSVNLKTTQSNSGRLVGCQPLDAQRLLDSFQQVSSITRIPSMILIIPSQLLDSPDLNVHLRKSLNVAMRRISVRSGLYLTCYELKDVVQQGEYPVISGGFADIYQGIFQGRVVCLKTIRLCRNDQIEHMLKATSKEAILWRQLLHPNVSTLFGLYRFRNRISIVSEWMENGDITIYLKKNPTAPRQRLARSGLTYLHKNSIIHGDLKGANILVDDVGRARLTDFGISSISDTQIIAWTTQSSGNTRGGSTRWQAPELFAVGDSDVDDEEVEAAVKNTMASDVYALGCVFFEVSASQSSELIAA
ncbi:hypothetical protein DXG01_006750 [Tephrocybe rancida]|nr:hypothetical protein DXG01_006750 [Tephrocybe rancida]